MILVHTDLAGAVPIDHADYEGGLACENVRRQYPSPRGCFRVPEDGKADLSGAICPRRGAGLVQYGY